MNKLQQFWNAVQDLLDISGDVWMGLFTGFILYKISRGILTGCDTAAYASAVTAFAYSNKGSRS